MNEILEEIYRKGAAETPDGKTVKIGGHVSISEGEFLQNLIRQQRPTVTLEVGLAYGVSALFICEALTEVGGERHIVIDPAQHTPCPPDDVGRYGIGLHHLKRAKLDPIIEFFEEPSFRVLPRLEMQGRKIDFALIDGWTTFDFKLVDFFFIDRLLSIGGTVVVRVGWTPAGMKLCRYIATNLPYRCVATVPARSAAASMPERILRRLVSRPPLRKRLEDLLKSEILRPDAELGLGRDMVAFRKEQEDTRKWSFHVDF